MVAYFAECHTVAAMKSLYRLLAMEHHPDHGGDCKIMQAINAQYKQGLCRLDGTEERGSDGAPHVYRYNEAVEQAVMDKLNELLALRLPGCDILMIGTWLWIQGETRPVKDILKAVGLSWHSKRLCWYWKPYEFHGRYNSRCDLNALAATYGAAFYTNTTPEPAGALA
jgi:hypothetical protein